MRKKKNVFDVLVGSALMVIVGIMPLIARLSWRPLPPELSNLLHGEGYVDFLSYWKGIFVLIPAFAIALFFIGDIVTRGKMPNLREFFRKPYVVFSCVFLIFMLISAVFATFSGLAHTAWLGTYHRDEGAFMWIAYFIVFFAAIHFAREIDNAKHVLYALAFSSIIMGVIGISQFAGADFFGTGVAAWLTTVGTPFFDQRHEIDIAFEIAYGTLFNPNTFGKYTAMASPILLVSAVTLFISAARQARIGHRSGVSSATNSLKSGFGAGFNVRLIGVAAIVFVAGLLMLFGVFASSSLGGLIGIITALGVLVVTLLAFGVAFLRRSEEKISTAQKFTIKIAAASSVGLILIFGFTILFFPPLNERVTFLVERIGREMAADTTEMQNYVFDENMMTVYGEDGKILSMTVHGREGDWLTVRDGAGNVVPPASRTEPLPQHPDEIDAGLPPEPAVYTFEIPGYRTVTIRHSPQNFSYHHARGGMAFFMAYQNGRLHGIHGVLHMDRIFDVRPGQTLDLHRETPAWGFEGRETWGSSRGYIWSRSLPMMPARTIIGSGPDSFINVFPNGDMVAGWRYFNNPYQIVDKAHNFFIQTWITTGGVSALALLALFGYYLFTTLRSLIKSKDEPIFSFGLRLGLLAGVAAYCMAGMATDTTIGSTGVFFVLLGVGYGLNGFAAKTLGAVPLSRDERAGRMTGSAPSPRKGTQSS
ncbi:MAG: O-antigen ligase family protein [Defluviitaleaceae bacterium]|nr:O-antigen ligase family protein [Defluviitaleaceae bacterium]